MKSNPYFPFDLVEHAQQFSIILIDLKWDVFEEEGFLGNGYDWQRLTKNLLKDQPLHSKIHFESEADMFCAVSSSKEHLQALAELLAPFYQNSEKLREGIKQYAQYE